VYNEQLVELVRAAVAAGQVQPELLPQLQEAHSQLQLLLHQEQQLGEAIEMLRSPAAAAARLGGTAAKLDSSSSSSSKVMESREQGSTLAAPSAARGAQEASQHGMAAAAPAAATAAAGAFEIQTASVRLSPSPAAVGGSREPAAVLQDVGNAPPLPLPGLESSLQLLLTQRLLGRQLRGAKVAFVVHNGGYQGVFKGRLAFDRLGLPQKVLSAFVAPAARTAAAAAAAVEAARAAAVSSIGSQLGALAEALKRLMPHASSNEQSAQRSTAAGAAAAGAAAAGAAAAGAAAAGAAAAGAAAAGAAAVGAAAADEPLGGFDGASERIGLLASMQELLLNVSASSSLDDAAAAADLALAQQEEQQQQLELQLASAIAAVASEQQDNHDDNDDDDDHAAAAASGGAAAAAAAGIAAADDSQVELSWLRAGVAGSDVVVTVSPGYAAELLGDDASANAPTAAAAVDLAALLATKGLKGIMNGLDSQAWDPSRDPLLPTAVRYTAATAAAGKAAAKQLLQRRLGLAVDPTAPLFISVGRLTTQKGVDVLLAALPQIMRRLPAEAAAAPPPAAAAEQQQQQQQETLPVSSSAATARRGAQQQQRHQSGGEAAAAGPDAAAAAAAAGMQQAAASLAADLLPENNPLSASTACGTAAAAAAAAAGGGGGGGGPQLVLLGKGEAWMEAVLSQLAGRYPGAAVGIPAFNDPLAHLMMAAGDYLLMPSRYEPCGLVALAGLRYGVVPIASSTGGLRDIVRPELGYQVPSPGAPGDTAAFRRAVAAVAAAASAAVKDYGSESFAARRAAGMTEDVSWLGPGQAWERLLQELATGAGSDEAAAGGGGEGGGPVTGADGAAAAAAAAAGVEGAVDTADFAAVVRSVS
jgi:glycogen synthase